MIKQKLPALRFPDFNDCAEDHRLTDLCHRIGDGIHSTPRYSEKGDFYFVNGNNLQDGTIKISATTKTLDAEEAGNHVRPLSEDTILLSINGTIGNMAFYRSERVVLGKSACYLNIDREVANKHFIYSLLNTERVRNYFDSELTGSTIKNLSLAAIRNLRVVLPALPEQRKIAEFLTAVDGRIAQLERKKALLEDYKKGVMQQLFTQAIRFKDDHGKDFAEWEELGLGKVCAITKGKQLNRDDLEEGGAYPAINGGVTPSGYTNDFNMPSNTITISEGGNSCGFVNFITTRFWSGGHCYTLQKLSSQVVLSYLFQFLKGHEQRIMALRVGSGLPNIQKAAIAQLPVLLPSPAEQTKIAEFLTALDRKIEGVGRQIAGSKGFKRGLLQQMFV